MKYFVTGGCGFLGSNLAAEALRRGHSVVVFDNLSRLGSERNLAWLQSIGGVCYISGDVRNQEDVERAIRKHMPDRVFHLAGQVAMTTSLESPRLDFETNALGSFNVLESVRKFCPSAAVLYSSTNKVYGDLEWTPYVETPTRFTTPDYPAGFPETIPLEFHSPYGCSKGAADQYMQDFHRMYGLKTVVFRHSSMYGGRQFSSSDQGWIGWFCQKAIEAQKDGASSFTISGTGKQVRDVLHADDMISLYFRAAEEIDRVAGQVFNIGGGIDNSLSLIELFVLLESQLSTKLRFERLPVRQSDQRVFVADIAKAHQLLGWKPSVTKEEGISRMLDWVRSAGPA